MKVAIINNKQAARKELIRIVGQTSDHEVVWSTSSGASAIEFCKAVKPELILMDPLVRDIDGISVIRQIMAETPCAILIVTGSIEDRHEIVFDALGAGAIDAVNTPILDSKNYEAAAAALLKKISIINVLTRDSLTLPESINQESLNPRDNPVETNLVIIGCSSGGPEALAELLGNLPKEFQSPIVVVQHVDAAFAPGLATWLNVKSALPVGLAREGDELVPGRVLLASTNSHLVLSADNRLTYTDEPASSSYRPSVDVFFESVARNWKQSVTAIILTGMGRDGAKGMLELHRKGAHTIAQDKFTSAVYGMPKAAIESGAAIDVLPIHRIADVLTKYSNLKEKKVAMYQD
ncbi:chemotaxis-specific protein-glutamate methyltransferase CheB [Kaarinaea lacus]